MNRYPNFHNEVPTRVLVCGDWHGNLRHAKAAIALAERVGADGILHVGDFGWGWVRDHAKTFNIPVEEELTKRDIFLIWADGNHENHGLIRSLPIREDGFVQTGDTGRLFWSPRANRWNWWGVEFATMGGAYSINREDYIEGKTVFSDLEEVTAEDVIALGTDKVDVMLTHDVPAGAYVRKSMGLEPWKEQQAFVSRHLLRLAVENTHPDLVFSGHWHQRTTSTLARTTDSLDTTVHVLHMDGYASNAVILDIPDLDVIETINRDKSWHLWNRKREKKERSAAARAEFRANRPG